MTPSALRLAMARAGVTATPSGDGDGLNVSADAPALDAYVIALGHAGIAVRRLEQRASSLESLFLQLTADRPAAGPAVDGAAAAHHEELS